jgi:hypothetical protein
VRSRAPDGQETPGHERSEHEAERRDEEQRHPDPHWQRRAQQRVRDRVHAELVEERRRQDRPEQHGKHAVAAFQVAGAGRLPRPIDTSTAISVTVSEHVG